MPNEKITMNFGVSKHSRKNSGPYIERIKKIEKNKAYPVISSFAPDAERASFPQPIKNYTDTRKREGIDLPGIIIPLSADGCDEYSIKLIWFKEFKKWLAFKYSTWPEESHRNDEEEEGPFSLNEACMTQIQKHHDAIEEMLN